MFIVLVVFLTTWFIGAEHIPAIGQAKEGIIEILDDTFGDSIRQAKVKVQHETRQFVNDLIHGTSNSSTSNSIRNSSLFKELEKFLDELVFKQTNEALEDLLEIPKI